MYKRQEIKTGNAGFDFFQQLVVGGDLPVYFTLVGADAAQMCIRDSYGSEPYNRP